MLKSSCTTVLSTPELIAIILSHLRFYDLLLSASLVSGTWRRTILTTPTLQRTLFLRCELPSVPITLNPFLIRSFPLLTLTPPQRQYYIYPRDEQLAYAPTAEALGKRDGKFRDQSRSWRNMVCLMGGCKITTVRVREKVETIDGWWEKDRLIELPDGFRMGLLWTLIKGWDTPEKQVRVTIKVRRDPDSKAISERNGDLINEYIFVGGVKEVRQWDWWTQHDNHEKRDVHELALVELFKFRKDHNERKKSSVLRLLELSKKGFQKIGGQ